MFCAQIAEYNQKYIGTALSSVFDDRTAKASHVLFGYAKYDNGEADASALKARIESGDISFADAAKEYSTCPSAARGGDLGTFKKGAMVPEFDAVCFDENTPLGEGVALVKTQCAIVAGRSEHTPTHRLRTVRPSPAASPPPPGPCELF